MNFLLRLMTQALWVAFVLQVMSAMEYIGRLTSASLAKLQILTEHNKREENWEDEIFCAHSFILNLTLVLECSLDGDNTQMLPLFLASHAIISLLHSHAISVTQCWVMKPSFSIVFLLLVPCGEMACVIMSMYSQAHPVQYRFAPVSLLWAF